MAGFLNVIPVLGLSATGEQAGYTSLIPPFLQGGSDADQGGFVGALPFLNLGATEDAEEESSGTLGKPIVRVTRGADWYRKRVKSAIKRKEDALKKEADELRAMLLAAEERQARKDMRMEAELRIRLLESTLEQVRIEQARTEALKDRIDELARILRDDEEVMLILNS